MLFKAFERSSLEISQETDIQFVTEDDLMKGRPSFLIQTKMLINLGNLIMVSEVDLADFCSFCSRLLF